MRAVIIGNGTICDYDYIKSRICDNDYIICADGGLKHIKKLGIKPDIAIGDFDSSAPSGENCKIYPVRKDFTDGELAVNYAIENGYDEILLIAMTGERLDHTLTDIFLLSRKKGMRLIDDKNEIMAIKDSLELKGYKGKTLSIIPVFGNLEGITTCGLEYPLDNETLYFAQSRGNSNVVTDDECKIEVKSGIGLIIINNGE